VTANTVELGYNNLNLYDTCLQYQTFVVLIPRKALPPHLVWYT